MKLQPHSRQNCQGMALGTVMVILSALLVAVVVVLGIFLYLNYSDKAKLERKLAEVESQRLKTDLDQKQALEETRLVTARNRQNELLAHARKATNALERLRAVASQVAADAAALKTSEGGRRVALHPDLVSQARRLYDTELRELPPSDEIVTRLESVRRIQLQVADKLGSGYDPDAELTVTTQDAGMWAQQKVDKVAQVQSLLSALIQESKVKVTTNVLTTTSPTLEGAIDHYKQAEEALRVEIIRRQTEPAKTNAAVTQANAEAERILTVARAEAAKTTQDAKELMAKIQQEIEKREATNKLEETKTTIAVKTVEDEAAKLVLKKKASTPQVQVKLGPFITPGYWFPRNQTSVEKKPHSFSQLQSMGALTPTIKGMEMLVIIAIDPGDKVRPRWKRYTGGRRQFTKDPDEIERIKDVQNLLIELGAVLVEMGQLQP